MATIEVKVPDIGDYSDVPVIELLVKVGDTVAKDQGLLTLESDKATLEVPSPAAGVVKELKVKLGDKLSEGVVVAVLDTTWPASFVTAAPSAFWNGSGMSTFCWLGQSHAAPASTAMPMAISRPTTTFAASGPSGAGPASE